MREMLKNPNNFFNTRLLRAIEHSVESVNYFQDEVNVRKAIQEALTGTQEIERKYPVDFPDQTGEFANLRRKITQMYKSIVLTEHPQVFRKARLVRIGISYNARFVADPHMVDIVRSLEHGYYFYSGKAKGKTVRISYEFLGTIDWKFVYINETVKNFLNELWELGDIEGY